ncbi:dolichyl-diphosphooligosaccharide--protein glycosyltransferase subunit STT3, partial [Candidatus Woesearchaeota archaeon]|nr:dolichyl-diphosphooligosaccharide--protein glycosyltransferase subunit STT3 [Candidatus Woesearchaeota archaeon]
SKEIERQEKIEKIKDFFKRKKKKPEEAIDKKYVKEEIEEEKDDISEKQEEISKEIERQEKVEKIKDEAEETIEKEDEEINFDFGKIKEKIKNVFKKEGKEDGFKEESSEEEISVDWGNVINFLKKNKYAIPILLILIAMFFSIYFRIQPAYLPVTDDWAENTVYNFYRNQIKSEISKEYPNLPDANKNDLVENQFQEILKTQKGMIKQQIEQLSQQYKANFKDSDGQTYLLAIDPYLWYGEVRNYLQNGHFGTDIVDGKDINFLRNGREGKPGQPGSAFHLYFGVYLYKFISIFSNASLMTVFFFIPLIIVTLSVIPAFFIGKRVGGNIGGFFAAMIIAVNAALLSRTPAGFADTDAYNIFFPLMMAWMFIEAFEATDKKKDIIYAGLAGLFAGLYAATWTGWWYVFDFILASVVIFLGYYIFINRKDVKKGMNIIKDVLFTTGIFVFSSALFVSLFGGINKFLIFLKGPLSVMTIKEVAVTTLWPNVLTTVAEFNEVPLGQIMGQMGGRFLFLIAIIGIILTVIRTDKYGNRDIKYASFLVIWFIGTAYGFTKGMRFAILMVPAFAIAFGVCIGIIYQYLSKWISKELHINKHITRTVIVVLLLLLLVSPLKAAARTAKGEVPSMNDAWYDSLIGIKEDSEDAITTSWWDFGHWFVAISERRVTFDGADQGERIHWVGKSLLTESEKVAVGILRMLNCGQEKAPHVLEGYLDNDTVKSVDVLNEIILYDKKEAGEILKKEGLSKKAIENVLDVTHCDGLIPQYYIASEDMIGKAGVWGHFGSWDFNRALMWQTVRNLDVVKGTKVLREEFGLSEEEADNIYYEIQNNKADRWVSPWPSYLSGSSGCNEEDGIVRCVNGLEIDLDNSKAVVSTQQGKISLNSLAFINTKEEFELKEIDANSPLSAALIPSGDGFKSVIMDPKLAGSMFTRLFFFDGHGLQHFKLFSDKMQLTGGRIQVWKVGWEEGEPISILKEESEEDIIAEEENNSNNITEEE